MWKDTGEQSHRTLNNFAEWREQQNAEIAKKGADADPAVEEAHNQFMLRQNLNAYVCHKALDTYTACLKKNKLLQHDENANKKGGAFEVNVKNRMNERMCPSAHREYAACLSSQKNHEAVLESAALNPQCGTPRQELFACIENNKAVEAQTQEAQCMEPYRRLLRCGLNHMWNTYWRALTKFGDMEEFRLFDMSRDDLKRQEVLNRLTMSDAELEEIARTRREQRMGYYAHATEEERGGGEK